MRLALTSWLKCLVLVGALVLSAAARSDATAPPEDSTPAGGSLAGQLLVAAPEITDPRFRHAVILVVWQNDGGALGIIINQPVEERSLANLMAAIGKPDATVEGSLRIFSGGPVEPGVGFVVHSTDYHRPETVAIDAEVAMTSSPEVLRDLGHHRGPEKALVAFGYTGWAPGQLEQELAQQQWFTAPASLKLLFDQDRDKVWDDAMAQRTRAL